MSATITLFAGVTPLYRVVCESCIYDGEPLTFPTGLSVKTAELLADFHNERCHPQGD